MSEVGKLNKAQDKVYKAAKAALESGITATEFSIRLKPRPLKLNSD